MVGSGAAAAFRPAAVIERLLTNEARSVARLHQQVDRLSPVIWLSLIHISEPTRPY